MNKIEITQKIASDIGPRGEDYGVPWLHINPNILTMNGYKVGDVVKITIRNVNRNNYERNRTAKRT